MKVNNEMVDDEYMRGMGKEGGTASLLFWADSHAIFASSLSSSSERHFRPPGIRADFFKCVPEFTQPSNWGGAVETDGQRQRAPRRRVYAKSA